MGAENVAWWNTPSRAAGRGGYLSPDPPVFLAQLNGVVAGYAPSTRRSQSRSMSAIPTSALVGDGRLPVSPLGTDESTGRIGAGRLGGGRSGGRHLARAPAVADLHTSATMSVWTRCMAFAPTGATCGSASGMSAMAAIRMLRRMRLPAQASSRPTFTDADLRPSWGGACSSPTRTATRPSCSAGRLCRGGPRPRSEWIASSGGWMPRTCRLLSPPDRYRHLYARPRFYRLRTPATWWAGLPWCYLIRGATGLGARSTSPPGISSPCSRPPGRDSSPSPILPGKPTTPATRSAALPPPVRRRFLIPIPLRPIPAQRLCRETGVFERGLQRQLQRV